MRCWPDYYFALFGAGLIVGGIRALLFRNAKLRLPADRSWELDRFGAFSWFATGLACVVGFMSADPTSRGGAALTLLYNVFVLLFSVGAIRFVMRDWQTHLACLSKAVGWRNVLGQSNIKEPDSSGG